MIVTIGFKGFEFKGKLSKVLFSWLLLCLNSMLLGFMLTHFDLGDYRVSSSIIDYSPSYCSKPVRPLFIFVTKIYIWLNPRASWLCIDNNATTIFKAQKGSKDIIKIVHVTSVVQP